MHLRFGETESAFDYMLATREYVEKHGKPLAFYSDKHGIFGNDSNLLIVFYVQIMPDDLVMQLHRF